VKPETAFIVLITEGTAVAFAPEVYLSESRARMEAQQWAMSLAAGEPRRISIPFEGRWIVAERDVRLVEVPWAPMFVPDPWVGTYWTEDGYPDPEAELFWGREDARMWVAEPPTGVNAAAEFLEESWMLAATFPRGDDYSYAVAHMAKLIPTSS
jgi:hypothetical protein